MALRQRRQALLASNIANVETPNYRAIDIEAIREFEAVARGIRERLPQYEVESGFLEFAQPIARPDRGSRSSLPLHRVTHHGH